MLVGFEVAGAVIGSVLILGVAVYLVNKLNHGPEDSEAGKSHAESRAEIIDLHK